MIGHFRKIIALVCVAWVAGCGSDGALGPGAVPEFSIRVTPDETVLFAGGPGNTRRLGVEVLDTNQQLVLGSYSVAYSSSAPGIAAVGTDGEITGVAPGTALITTTVTMGGVKRAATTGVTVATTLLDYWRVAGTYDLTATLGIGIDPAWWDGPVPTWEYSGTLTFPSGSNQGTSANLQMIDGSGERVFFASGGAITLDVPAARGLFELRLGSNWVARVDSVEQGGGNAASFVLKGVLYGLLDVTWVEGTKSYPGSIGIGGPFVATLRP